MLTQKSLTYFIIRFLRRPHIQSGEPFGRAGAYAVQGLAATFIEHLSGSYSSVMGLPVFEVARLLQG